MWSQVKAEVFRKVLQILLCDSITSTQRLSNILNLLRRIRLENNNLCKTPSILEVEGISFEHIPEALFSESLSCLEHVTFHNTFGYSATDAQIEMLISRIVAGKGLSRLRSLSLILVSLCHLDPVLLISLVSSEVRLTLTDCRVTVSQMREIQKKFKVWEVEHQSNSKVRINVKNFKQ